MYEITHFGDGPARYVGVYRDPHGVALPTRDRVQVRFTGKAHTYDVRQGKYLGHTDRAPLAIGAEDAALFARFPYPVERVEVQARGTFPGGPVRLAVAVGSGGKVGRHVVRIDVVDPNGKAHYLYSRNVVAKAGRWQGVIHTALDDPAGTWQVRAHEVTSGVSARASFALGSPGR